MYNPTVEELIELLKAAVNALRSYQYGNSSPDLAEEVANEIDLKIKDLI